MKVGLVLAGGGGHGAYELGVWKALVELGIDKYIKVVSGTSIGALNAVLFVQNDIQCAEKIWSNVSVEKILPMDNKEFIKKAMMISWGLKNIDFIKKHMRIMLNQGNLSRDGLLEIIDNYIDIEKIRTSKIPCYITCTELPEIKPKYFKLQDYDENKIKSILLATSAIPTIFENEEIDTKKYLDGGVVDNVPVQPVYGQGCDIIIVVQLSKSELIDRRVFPKAKIIEIVPTEIDEGVLNGTLNFNQEAIKRRIHQGHEDTINLLVPILKLAEQKINDDNNLKIKLKIKFIKLSNNIKGIIDKIFKNKFYNNEDKSA